jgi:hypothetical protein
MASLLWEVLGLLDWSHYCVKCDFPAKLRTGKFSLWCGVNLSLAIA